MIKNKHKIIFCILALRYKIEEKINNNNLKIKL